VSPTAVTPGQDHERQPGQDERPPDHPLSFPITPSRPFDPTGPTGGVPYGQAREQAESLGIPLQHLIMHRTARKPADAWVRELLATLHARGVKSAMVIGPPFQMRRMALLFDMVFADGGWS
jgi:uncharacterized SAM-binding protein YcdF (DUF218 family)